MMADAMNEYEKLKAKGYTDEEIAEAFIFPLERTPEQERELAKEIRNFIKEHRAKMSFKERFKTKLTAKYLCWKFRIEDWLYSLKNKYE